MIKFRVKKKLIFVYSPDHRHNGSTVMRGEQLSSIIAHNINDDGYKVSFESLSKKFRNSIVFMTKMAVATASIDKLESLVKANNILLFDANDGKIEDAKLRFADVIVVSSSVGLDNYKIRYPDKRIILIDHHVDPRINKKTADISDRPRLGYFGEPTNTIITDNIKDKVDFFHVDTSSQVSTSWLDSIADYNVHYAVRDRRFFDDFKPATKVFTAAYCGANVVIQESEEEAVRWLGSDYPYIIKGDLSEDSILSMLDKVVDTYMGPEWYRGLSVMRSIEQKLSQERIAGQFRSLLRALK